jgi:NADH dehydrogenase
VTTVLHWAVSFIGRGRAQRTTTHQQLVARAASITSPPERAETLPYESSHAAIRTS